MDINSASLEQLRPVAWAMGIFRWKDLGHLRRLILAWPHGEVMAEPPRYKSDPRIPIPASEAREVLEAEGNDDMPTQPDLRVPCPRCFDTRKVKTKTDAGHAFVACPECKPKEDAR